MFVRERFQIENKEIFVFGEIFCYKYNLVLKIISKESYV